MAVTFAVAGAAAATAPLPARPASAPSPQGGARPAPPQAPAAPDSAAVAATVEGYHRALAAGDSAAALAVLAPDVVILESGGAESLGEYQSHHLAGDIAFARGTRTTRSPVRVLVRGDAAWATSTSTVVGTFRGRPVNSAGAELMVLTREPAGWRIAAIHWSSRARRAAP